MIVKAKETVTENGDEVIEDFTYEVVETFIDEDGTNNYALKGFRRGFAFHEKYFEVIN